MTMTNPISMTDLLDPLSKWYELHFQEALSPEKLDKFKGYLELLREWNQKLNLTAITEPGEMVRRHFIDSLSGRLAVDFQPGMRVLDVGTGAGFPGIPLIIGDPLLKVYLLETVGKKAQFLNLVKDKLNLERLVILNQRAEILSRMEEPQALRESFDVVVSRALAKLPTGVEYCLPFVKIGGIYLVQLGEDAQNQLHQAQYAIAQTGGQLEKVLKMDEIVNIPHRSCVQIRKINPTPVRYPRKPGIAFKRPLLQPKTPNLTQ